MNKLSELLEHYRREKANIKKRLTEFRSLRGARDEEIFQELCFCLLTPQSKAAYCDRAIRDLAGSGLLLEGGAGRIKLKLKGFARFHNKKAVFIVKARDLFTRSGHLAIKDSINIRDTFTLRDWLVENVKGMGYKEASHFLRNIGLGEDMAILDRHILKNLKRYAVIDKIPPSLGSRKAYLDIENKVKDFCEKIHIPPGELDLLLWSKETGYIFK